MRLEEAHAELQQHRDAAEVLEAENEELRRLAASPGASDMTISVLRMELQASEDRRAELEESEEKRAALQGELQASEEKRAALQGELQASEEKRAALQGELEESEEKRASLQAEVEAAEAEIEAVMRAREEEQAAAAAAAATREEEDQEAEEEEAEMAVLARQSASEAMVSCSHELSLLVTSIRAQVEEGGDAILLLMDDAGILNPEERRLLEALSQEGGSAKQAQIPAAAVAEVASRLSSDLQGLRNIIDNQAAEKAADGCVVQ